MDSIRRVWRSWSPGWRTPWLAGTPTQLCSCGLANAESVASEPTSVISVALLHPSSTSPLRRDPLKLSEKSGSGQSAEHDTAHGGVDQNLASGAQTLVVATEPPVLT